MRAPIIVDDAGDLLIFESIEDAQRYIDPFGLNQLTGYDSQGWLLRFSATRRSGWLSFARRTTIHAAELEPTHATELREKLIAFLEQLGVQREWLLSASLEQILIKGLEFKTK